MRVEETQLESLKSFRLAFLGSVGLVDEYSHW